MPGSNKYSTYQGTFGEEPNISTKKYLTSKVENDDLRSIKNFKLAFKTARQRGLNTFKWGNSVYTTELKKTPSILVDKLKNEGIVNDNNSQGSRKLIPKKYYADMIKKGFKWDINKQMWFKPKLPIVEVEAPKPLGVVKYKYFQQGGSINMNDQQLQQAFIQFLALKFGTQNRQELEAAILLLGEEGLQQAYQEFMSMMQQLQVQAAKFGAKINYIKSLRGVCPEGYEMLYFKLGGTLCKKCIKKQEEMKQEREIPDNPIDAFKCGGKKKKKVKKENGGLLETFDKVALNKCGAKLKEDACGAKLKKR